MVLFHDLAAQLKSFCSSSGREASRAPAQIIDSEVSFLIPQDDCTVIACTLQQQRTTLSTAKVSILQWRCSPKTDITWGWSMANAAASGPACEEATSPGLSCCCICCY